MSAPTRCGQRSTRSRGGERGGDAGPVLVRAGSGRHVELGGATGAELVLEDGTAVDLRVRSGSARLPRDLPIGRHLLRSDGGRAPRRAVLVAPPRTRDAGAAPDLGVFLPLYALAGPTGTDLGDLADLERLGAGLAAIAPGPLAIALLPLLATRPESPSPYSPVSRRFWNELHLDLTALPGGPDALADAGRAARIATRRADRHVDWAAVAADVHGVLDAVVDALGDRLDAETAGDALLHRYARFRAAGDRRAERRHLAGQWAMRIQLDRATTALAAREQTLVLDLPVGAAGDGFDVGDNPDQFLAGWSVGAPPDPLFAGGQAWGFPPPLPSAAGADGHRLFAESLATLARFAGVVRIDHVMALQRLWWIPPGAPATEGVYVRYPTDELVAVVAIESHRHGAVIVGEDLGTVSASVRARMRRSGMLGMHEEQFAIDAAADAGLTEIPAEVVAGLNTHDMPTFAGFCRGADVHDHADLGLHDRAGADAALARRGVAVAAYAALLGARPELRPLLAAALRRVGASAARVVSVSLEDLWLEPEPQNVPGTASERANWTRRLAVPAGCHRRPSRRPGRPGAAQGRPSGRPVPRRPHPCDPPAAGRATDRSLPLTGSRRHVRPAARPRRPVPLQRGHPPPPPPRARRPARPGGRPGSRSGRPTRGRSASPATSTVGAGAATASSRRGRRASGRPRSPPPPPGDLYRYRIVTGEGALIEKTDPVAAAYEEPPATAAVIADLGHEWGDGEWMASRGTTIGLDAPVSIYEVHLGSWGRTAAGGDDRFPGYRQIATSLAEHVLAHGFTHVELLPIMEHPFYGSWGYQTTGYFAPTARYGSPTDFMALVDHLHQEGVGVILDWVPSHFPTDPFALAHFDGTHLYEHADPRLGWHPDWDSAIFNYGRHEVRSFLVSSAICWLERYHADGLRVDAVASMLYRDYSRRHGRVAAERVRRQGEPRGDRLPEGPERGRLRRAPRRRHLRRGVHGVADGEQADVHRRAGVRLQVGHGVDARHPAVLLRGSRAPALAPPRARRSAPCTPSARTTPCPSRTTRSSTARARCSPRCPATTGSSTPTCACCSAGSGRSQARSCSSWAARWPSAASGPTRAVSSGTATTIRPARASGDG